MSDFALTVGGAKYLGWTSLSVTRSLEELAHSFSVSLTDRWSEDSKPVPIKVGEECSIAIDGEVITTGYIGNKRVTYDATNRNLQFSGRSKTGDLVDCAAVYRKGQWRNKRLVKIAENLCDPYGITVTANVDLGAALRRFSIQDGESVFSCLERGARMRGAMLLTDASGNLVFDRVSTTKIDTVLRYGDNIKRGSLVDDWQDRFSEYVVKTQIAGDDNTFGLATSKKRTSEDDGVGRYRPTIILAENEDSGAELQKRADWERNTRAGRSKRLSYQVVGWKHSQGPWSPNQLVRVIDTAVGVDDELLVVSTTQSRGDDGTITSLELTLPEAFDVQPLPPPSKDDESFWEGLKAQAVQTVEEVIG